MLCFRQPTVRTIIVRHAPVWAYCKPIRAASCALFRQTKQQKPLISRASVLIMPARTRFPPRFVPSFAMLPPFFGHEKRTQGVLGYIGCLIGFFVRGSLAPFPGVKRIEVLTAPPGPRFLHFTDRWTCCFCAYASDRPFLR